MPSRPPRTTITYRTMNENAIHDLQRLDSFDRELLSPETRDQDIEIATNWLRDVPYLQVSDGEDEGHEPSRASSRNELFGRAANTMSEYWKCGGDRKVPSNDRFQPEKSHNYKAFTETGEEINVHRAVTAVESHHGIPLPGTEDAESGVAKTGQSFESIRPLGKEEMMCPPKAPHLKALPNPHCSPNRLFGEINDSVSNVDYNYHKLSCYRQGAHANAVTGNMGKDMCVKRSAIGGNERTNGTMRNVKSHSEDSKSVSREVADIHRPKRCVQSYPSRARLTRTSALHKRISSIDCYLRIVRHFSSQNGAVTNVNALMRRIKGMEVGKKSSCSVFRTGEKEMSEVLIGTPEEGSENITVGKKGSRFVKTCQKIKAMLGLFRKKESAYVKTSRMCGLKKVFKK